MEKSIQLFIFILFLVIKGHGQDNLSKAYHHYDNESATFKGKIEILIKRNEIIEIGNNLKVNTDKIKVIDLAKATLLPGLIDSHTHLFIEETLHQDYTGFGETVVNEAVQKTVNKEPFKQLLLSSHFKCILNKQSSI